jgi:hypothetical protein
VSFPRRNYGDISVTVLRPVHVGDSLTFVLLSRAGWVVDDKGAVVWRVCSGWGLLSAVHSVGISGAERKQVAHRHMHSRCCDGWGSRAQSFLGRAASGRRSALGPLPNPGGEFLDVIEDFTSLGHLGEDFPLGVHDRGVVAAECLPDLRQ